MELKNVIGSTDIFNLPDFIKIGLMSTLFMMLVFFIMSKATQYQNSRGNVATYNSNVVEVNT